MDRVSYDPLIIQNFANDLYRKAKIVVLVYTGVAVAIRLAIFGIFFEVA